MCSDSWWDGCRGVPKSTHDAPQQLERYTPMTKKHGLNTTE